MKKMESEKVLNNSGARIGFKKLLIAATIICLPIFGCGKSDGGSGAPDSTGPAKTVSTPEKIDVQSLLDDAATNGGTVAAGDSATADAASQDNASTDATTETATTGDPSIDVDLTALSATMVYSEVFNMMYYPENYVGKTVKMEGLYDHYHDDASGNDYYSCIIQDATACCAQGIEFQLTDGKYPEDTVNDVTVEGVFQTYEENGAKYCTLVDAKLLN